MMTEGGSCIAARLLSLYSLSSALHCGSISKVASSQGPSKPTPVGWGQLFVKMSVGLQNEHRPVGIDLLTASVILMIISVTVVDTYFQDQLRRLSFRKVTDLEVEGDRDFQLYRVSDLDTYTGDWKTIFIS